MARFTRIAWVVGLLGLVAAPRGLSAERRGEQPLTVQVFVYYDVQDKAFERAAITRAAEVKGDAVQEFLKVKTKQDFLNAWKTIKSQAETNNARVVSVHLFTHASKQDDQQDGLEFANLSGQGGTLTKGDIEKLPKLPWVERNGQIVLYGCNTGLKETRSWCPAETFAKAQGVQTSGLAGYGYFSTDPDRYVKIGPNDKRIYLRAYRRGKNGILGDGKNIPEKVYKP